MGSMKHTNVCSIVGELLQFRIGNVGGATKEVSWGFLVVVVVCVCVCVRVCVSVSVCVCVCV